MLRMQKVKVKTRMAAISAALTAKAERMTMMDKKKMTVMTISQQPNLIGEAERITKVVRKVDLRVARQASNSKEDDNNRMTLTMTSTTVRTTSRSNNNNNKDSRNRRTSSSPATCRICRHK